VSVRACCERLCCVVLCNSQKEKNFSFKGELTCSTMVRRFDETLPARVQILLLAPFPEISLRFTGITW
jgi:hypothetical protein